MEKLTLKAEKREISGKHVKRIRAEGMVPAVLYGKEAETTLLQIESKALHSTLAKAGGNTLISLQMGKKESVPTLAREVQRDKIRHNILHVDFLQVVMTEKITAEIPLALIGSAPGVDDHGGILVHAMDSLNVECLPGDLPSTIEVDISSLANFNDTITVGDLTLPANVAITTDPDSVIVRIEAPRLVSEEEEEVAVEAVDVSAEPELVGRHREDEEGGENEE
jgi:large subunit ribosomal protein L25